MCKVHQCPNGCDPEEGFYRYAIRKEKVLTLINQYDEEEEDLDGDIISHEPYGDIYCNLCDFNITEALKGV